MSMRINIKFVFILFLLVVSFGLVSPQETSEEVDVGSLLGLEDLEIVGEGIEFEQLEDGLNRVTFSGENPNLKVGENVFENIVPAGEDGEAFIDLNSEGEIVEAFFTVGEGGGDYNLGGMDFKVYSESPVEYSSGKITLENAKIESVANEISLVGTNVEVSEGRFLEEGVLNFDNEGKAFLKNGDVSNIEGVLIDSKVVSGEKLNVFFDDDLHEGGFVNFGQDLIVSGHGGTPSTISFSERNPYLRIDEGDHVEINLFENSEARITNRYEEGLIPRINLQGDGVINNDGKVIKSKNGEYFLSLRDPEIKTTSSPTEIILENNLNEKVLVDNFNRFAVVPNNDIEEYFADAEGLNVKFSSRVKYNYVDEESIEKLTGVPIEINEDVIGGNKQFALGTLRDSWKTLTPETKEEIDKINIWSNEFMDREKSKAYAAFYTSGEGSITTRAGNILGANFHTTFRHEASHALYDKLSFSFSGQQDFIKENYPKLYQREKNVYKELIEVDDLIIKKEDEFLSQNDEFTLRDLNDRSSENYEVASGRFREYAPSLVYQKEELLKESFEINSEKRLILSSIDTFENKWKSVAGDHESLMEDYEPLIESDGSNVNSPFYGVVRQYGASTPGEDVATFVEKVNDPEFFKPLLSEENEWHEIYRGKLDLLYEYKFISEEEYFEILRATEEEE